MIKTKFDKENIYNDDVCGICGKSGDIPHTDCENKAQELAADYREKMMVMAKAYGISQTFGPSNLDSRMTLDDAVDILSQYLDHELTFDIQRVLENENWWYIPHGWVGVLGFIVEKDSKRIFCLGSGLRTEWNAIESYLNGEVEPVVKKT